MKCSSFWEFEADLPLVDRPRVVLGVDGGSTSTACICIDSEGDSSTILGRAIAGSSNHNSVGEEAARQALESVLAGALRSAGCSRSQVEALCLGISGVDTLDDEKRLHAWLRLLFPHTPHLYVYNDAVAALASGTLGKLHGCVLVVGTGTIAYGFTSDGLKVRAAGYGPVLGDQGSGYAIASQALAAVMRAQDGRGPPTSLSNAIMKKLQLKNYDQLISWAYADPSWARVAALVPVVKACAFADDAVALKILDEAVQELALSVLSVVQRLQLAGGDGTGEFPLVLVGGVLEANDDGIDILSAVVDCVRKSLPRVHPVRPQVEPAVGAALLARLQPRRIVTTNLCNGASAIQM